nr:unnamed protein product [Callosobruchus analis]
MCLKATSKNGLPVVKNTFVVKTTEIFFKIPYMYSIAMRPIFLVSLKNKRVLATKGSKHVYQVEHHLKVKFDSSTEISTRKSKLIVTKESLAVVLDIAVSQLKSDSIVNGFKASGLYPMISYTVGDAKILKFENLDNSKDPNGDSELLLNVFKLFKIRPCIENLLTCQPAGNKEYTHNIRNIQNLPIVTEDNIPLDIPSTSNDVYLIEDSISSEKINKSINSFPFLAKNATKEGVAANAEIFKNHQTLPVNHKTRSTTSSGGVRVHIPETNIAKENQAESASQVSGSVTKTFI